MRTSMVTEDGTQDDSEELAEAIVESVSAGESAKEDGLTTREREIERRVAEERRRKGEEVKRRLKSRGVSPLRYRWPAGILLGAALLSVWTEFSVVMVHPPGIGFDTFFEVYLEYGSVFFLFPIVSGIFLVLCAYWAYTDPRGTFMSIIPAMMMTMSSATVYWLVSFAVAADPNIGVHVTETPLTMLLVAVLCFLAIFMREKE